MSIKQDVTELNNLDTELKRLRARIKVLTEHKKRCEGRILEYLKHNNHPGIRVDGKVIVAQEQKRRKYKSTDKKRQDSIKVFEKYNIRVNENVLDELVETLKGSPSSKTTLKISDY